MPIAEIVSVVTSVKAAVDIAKGIGSLKVEVDRNHSIAELLTVLISVQTEALTVQAKAHELEIEKQELRKKLMELENWSEVESQYALEELGPGVFVYVYKETDTSGKPTHWLCANCFREQKKSILQSTGTFTRGTVCKCHDCGSEIIDTRNRAVSRSWK